jgi:hypothetical protein
VSTFLLDVNLLLALSDPLHLHHEAAHRWFAQAGASWATCPLTENGFVRVASNPAYTNRPGDAPLVLELLRQFCAHKGHQFWPDVVSLRELLRPGTAFTHKQLTDLYLLGLAASRGGKLATFDRHIPRTAVLGAAQSLELIEA